MFATILFYCICVVLFFFKNKNKHFVKTVNNYFIEQHFVTQYSAIFQAILGLKFLRIVWRCQQRMALDTFNNIQRKLIFFFHYEISVKN